MTNWTFLYTRDWLVKRNLISRSEKQIDGVTRYYSELTEDVELWFNESDIEYSPKYFFILGIFELQEIGFNCEEDMVAFKLRWS